MRNIDAVIEARGAATPKSIVVGAHYDSAPDTPGANDNASGTASVLELARLLRDLKGKTENASVSCFSSTRSRPISGPSDMGSLHYAQALAGADERVTAMYSLETLGYYSDAPGSQKYPPPFGLMFPDRGDFVSFVGLPIHDRSCSRRMRSFRVAHVIPDRRRRRSLVHPRHRLVRSLVVLAQGFQAVMITDTAPFRYPHYHEPTDTPDKVDTEKLARVVKGIERVLRDLVR